MFREFAFGRIEGLFVVRVGECVLFLFQESRTEMHSCVEVKHVFLEWQVAGFPPFHCLRDPVGNCVSGAHGHQSASASRSRNTCTCLKRKGREQN